MIIGYARVSTNEQNLDGQLDLLKKHGCERIFQEHASGAKSTRPELDRMLDQLRAGDVVIVVKLDRISRSAKHIIELSEKFEELGVDFVSINDQIDTTTPTGRFFFRLMASYAELERDLIVERTKLGLAAARARGRKGGRPKASEETIKAAKSMYKAGDLSIAEICNTLNISKSTLYRYLASEN